MSERLFAMDIEKREFNRKMRGYDCDEVRSYLRSVAEELARVTLENHALRDETRAAAGRLDEVRDRERTLQETLVTAQRLSDEMREKTRAESDIMIREARVKAERILEQAQDQLYEIENEIGRLRLEKDAFENRLRCIVDEHLALLELRKQERNELDNVRFLRRRSTTEVG